MVSRDTIHLMLKLNKISVAELARRSDLDYFVLYNRINRRENCGEKVLMNDIIEHLEVDLDELYEALINEED